MFGKGKRKHAPISTLVGSDTRVHGDVEFEGGFLVDGQVIGNVKAAGDAESMLSVSERGSIEGTVVAPHVLLNGTVRGDVYATERIELGPKSRVVGNVQYKLIEMSIGAEVNGKLIHESDKRATAAAKTAAKETTPENTVTDPLVSVKAVGE